MKKRELELKLNVIEDLLREHEIALYELCGDAPSARLQENSKLRLESYDRLCSTEAGFMFAKERNKILSYRNLLSEKFDSPGDNGIFGGTRRPRLTPAEEKIKSWAGEDLPYIEKQLRDVLRVPEDQDLQKSIHKSGLTVVTVEAKTLGTETLLLLSPEGETLFKITRNNAAKYSLK